MHNIAKTQSSTVKVSIMSRNFIADIPFNTEAGKHEDHSNSIISENDLQLLRKKIDTNRQAISAELEHLNTIFSKK